MSADPSSSDHPSGDVAQLSYEQARAELEEVVQALEAGGTTLEESLALWERGQALATVCQERLDGVRARLGAALEQNG
ncbi:MAG TPA: exodeoxyribonuclease VII small subunit [Mycobacteriales bacterium]|nr:exodeoxyribonuclease VII small subunit [Mycobacteriales bacterium]